MKLVAHERKKVKREKKSKNTGIHENGKSSGRLNGSSC